MLRSLVGSEMCIRDSPPALHTHTPYTYRHTTHHIHALIHTPTPTPNLHRPGKALTPKNLWVTTPAITASTTIQPSFDSFSSSPQKSEISSTPSLVLNFLESLKWCFWILVSTGLESQEIPPPYQSGPIFVTNCSGILVHFCRRQNPSESQLN